MVGERSAGQTLKKAAECHPPNMDRDHRTTFPRVPAGDAMVPMENIKVIYDDEANTAAHKSEWLDKFKDIVTQ